MNEVMVGRALAGEAVLRTAEAAMEVAGGAGFFRSVGLERLFRDVQGARYHALRAPGPAAIRRAPGPRSRSERVTRAGMGPSGRRITS